MNFLEVLPSNHTSSSIKSLRCLQEIDGYSRSNALALYYMKPGPKALLVVLYSHPLRNNLSWPQGYNHKGNDTKFYC